MRSDGILAHGIGGAKDLPISPELAIAGAVAALTVSFTVLAVAWREPRYDGATSGRPAPAWLARVVDSTGVPGRGARARHGRLPLRRDGRRPRQGPADQPGLRHLLRVVVGRPRAAVAAVRAGVEGDQPGPHHQPRVREALRQRPRPGRLHVPRAARLLAGRARPLRVRLDGAGLPVLHRARPGPAVVRGVRRADAGRRRAVRQHASTSAPTRSRSTRPGRQAVGLGHGATGSCWCAARWPTSTPRRSRPAWSG